MNMSTGKPEEEKPVPAKENKADAPNGDDESRKIKVYTEGSTESEVESETSADQAEMMMAELGAPKIYRIGDRVTGKVVQVKDDSLIVNIGTKNEGIVPREELSFVPNPSTEQYEPGHELDMVVIREADDDTYYLSRKRAEEEKAWKLVEDAHANNTRLIAVGNQVVSAGLILDMGIRGFLPMSHADIKRISIDDLVGKEFEVKVLEFDKESRPQRLVVSRRLCIEEDLTKERDQLYDKFKPGDIVQGKVEKLTSFGAFINLGGITGLLHISQMSRKRISDPSEAVKVGEEIEIKVIDIDREKQKIRLSRRDLLPDPWDEADKLYKPGDVVEGGVVRVTSFGAFIKIDNYFEGLAHISELVDNKINHAKEVFSPGDQVAVMILEIDKKRRRIRLSVKKAVEKEARREVDAFLKQQEDICNTLKIPAEGILTVVPEPQPAKPAEEKAEAATPAEEPPAPAEEKAEKAPPAEEAVETPPEVKEAPPEVEEAPEPPPEPAEPVAEATAEPTKTEEAKPEIETPPAAEVPETTPEPEQSTETAEAAEPAEAAEAAEPAEATEAAEPAEATEAAEPAEATEAAEPAEATEAAEPAETTEAAEPAETTEAAEPAEATEAAEPAETTKPPEPATEKVEEKLPEDAENAIPSKGHSVDVEKDLVSGDEFEDNGQPAHHPTSHRSEGNDIDLVEGNDLEDK